MTEAPEITGQQVMGALGNYFKGVAQVIGGFAAIGGIIWAVIGDTVTELLATPEAIAAMSAAQERQAKSIEKIEGDMAALTGRRPVLPILEFDGNVSVFPSVTAPGSSVTAVYLMRRNHDCPTMVEIRWWSVSAGAYDPQFQQTVEATRAVVTDGYAPFKLLLRIPADLPSGAWAYHPNIIPGPACPDDRSIQPPMAFITVVQND